MQRAHFLFDKLSGLEVVPYPIEKKHEIIRFDKMIEEYFKSVRLALEEVDAPFILLEDDCMPLNFIDEIEIPDETDALYLGISSWGRMNGHSGPCVQWECADQRTDLVRVWNILAAHAILYLNPDYVDLCKRIAYHGYLISDHHDIGFADIQKYYEVYAFENPMFYQTSSNGTDQPLSSYPSVRIMGYDERFWLPLEVKE